MIEVDGVEAARKSVSDLGVAQQREDFEFYPPQVRQTAPPGVLSARFARPPNDKTADLYKKAAEAERDKDVDKAAEFVKKIVALDPDDFIAWAKLGSLYLGNNSLSEAAAAFKRSLGIRSDYTPALLNLGMINAFQKQQQRRFCKCPDHLQHISNCRSRLSAANRQHPTM